VPLNYNLVRGIQEFTLEFRDRKRFDPLKVFLLDVLNFNLSESEAQPGAVKLQHSARTVGLLRRTTGSFITSEVFCDVTQCTLVDVHRRFEECTISIFRVEV
jgi:hypothetical protein